jgi:membrane associated rhomboid family serine protease
MVYLFLFGACVEDIMGRPRFIAFYLLSGLASEFMHIAISAGHFASEVPLGWRFRRYLRLHRWFSSGISPHENRIQMGLLFLV